MELLNEAFNNEEYSHVVFESNVLGQAFGTTWITALWPNGRKLECLFALYPEPALYLPQSFHFPMNSEIVRGTTGKSVLIIEGKMPSIKCPLADPQFFVTVGERLKSDYWTPVKEIMEAD